MLETGDAAGGRSETSSSSDPFIISSKSIDSLFLITFRVLRGRPFSISFAGVGADFCIFNGAGMSEGRGGGGISVLVLSKGTAETEMERARGLPGSPDEMDFEFVLERLPCLALKAFCWKALGGAFVGECVSSSSAMASTFRTDGLRAVCVGLAFRDPLDPFWSGRFRSCLRMRTQLAETMEKWKYRLTSMLLSRSGVRETFIVAPDLMSSSNSSSSAASSCEKVKLIYVQPRP